MATITVQLGRVGNAFVCDIIRGNGLSTYAVSAIDPDRDTAECTAIGRAVREWGDGDEANLAAQIITENEGREVPYKIVEDIRQ